MAIDLVSNPYTRGQENYRADYQLYDNPYCSEHDNHNHTEWVRGYIDAQDESLSI